MTGGWRLLRDLMRGRRPVLVRLALWSVVEAAPSLVSGLLVAAGLDRGFLAGRPVVGLAWFGAFGLVMVVRAAAGRALFPLLADVVEPVRDSLVVRVVTAAVGRAGGHMIDGAGVARVTGQVDTVRNLLATQLRTIRQFGVNIAVAIVGLAALSPWLTPIVLVPVLAAMAAFVVTLPSLSRRQRRLVLAGEAVAATVTPVMAGTRDVVACAAEPMAMRTVSAAVDANARAMVARAVAGSTRALIVSVGAKLPVLGLLVAAPLLIRAAHLSPGQIAGAVTYLTATMEPALQGIVGAVSSTALSLGVTLHRLAEHTRPPAATPATPTLVTGSGLRMANVTFSYGEHAHPIVENLTLDIPAGSHLAVVGPSGIGKSTLAGLLLGTVRPQGGCVWLGGVPVEQLDNASRGTHIALIPQEAYVFAGTLRENLSYLCPDADDAVLAHCVAAIGLGALVARLGGYDAELGDRDALSSGERQLIALARVYLSPADVVILDEATCYLDPAAETRAERAFAQRGGTLIVIAHRMSSAGRADRVLLMDGRSVVVDTHDNLVRSAPLYADLVGRWHQAPEAVPTQS